MKTILAFFLALTSSLSALTLAWDANPPEHLAGYSVHWGPVRGAPDKHLDVGNVTAYTVNWVGWVPPGSTYYFTVTAYNTSGVESLPSNEVSYLAPAAPTPTPTPTPAPTPTPPPTPTPTPAPTPTPGPPANLKFKAVFAPLPPTGYRFWGWRVNGQYIAVSGTTLIEAAYSKK